jgi:hypothetical protein
MGNALNTYPLRRNGCWYNVVSEQQRQHIQIMSRMNTQRQGSPRFQADHGEEHDRSHAERGGFSCSSPQLFYHHAIMAHLCRFVIVVISSFILVSYWHSDKHIMPQWHTRNRLTLASPPVPISGMAYKTAYSASFP